MTVTTTMVLDNLDGWYLDSEDVDELVAIHTISEARVTTYITKATNRVLSYLEITSTSDLPTSDLIDEAISTWTAGLLYQRDIDKEDPDKKDTRGTDLIQDAKDILKPLRIAGSSTHKIGMFTIGGASTVVDEDDNSDA